MKREILAIVSSVATLTAQEPAPDVVVLKLPDGVRAEVHDGALAGDVDLAAANRLLAHTEGLRRLFERPRAVLEAERRELLAALPDGVEPPADLDTYFIAECAPGRGETLANALAGLPVVATAYVEPPLSVASGDIAPTTPSFVPNQIHLRAAPLGVDHRAARVIAGGRGDGMRFADIEYGWIVGHEDICQLVSSNVTGNSASFEDHGTAVLGVIASDWNSYGTTGLADQSTFHCYGVTGSTIASTINTAAAALPVGGVLVIELQASPLGTLMPVEVTQANFDAIRAATLSGRHVIEAAGNGNQWLERSFWGPLFDPALRDSGAVLVGATTASAYIRSVDTNYGVRVDVNGWGASVMTCGYLQNVAPGDARQSYTNAFNGTSAATAMVAGVAIALLGAVEEQLGTTLTPAQLRDLLRMHGTDMPGELIGRRPDLAQLLAAVGLPRGLDLTQEAEPGGTLMFALDEAPGASYAVLFAFDRSAVDLGTIGRFLLAPHAFLAYSGVLDGNGSAQHVLPIPPDPIFRGESLFIQAAFADTTLRLSSSARNDFGK